MKKWLVIIYPGAAIHWKLWSYQWPLPLPALSILCLTKLLDYGQGII